MDLIPGVFGLILVQAFLSGQDPDCGKSRIRIRFLRWVGSEFRRPFSIKHLINVYDQNTDSCRFLSPSEWFQQGLPTTTAGYTGQYIAGNPAGY